MTTLVDISELKIATGYSNTADVEKCLMRNGVKVLYGKKGHIFTTASAFDKALGLLSESKNESIEFEDD